MKSTERKKRNENSLHISKSWGSVLHNTILIIIQTYVAKNDNPAGPSCCLSNIPWNFGTAVKMQMEIFFGDFGEKKLFKFQSEDELTINCGYHHQFEDPL